MPANPLNPSHRSKRWRNSRGPSSSIPPEPIATRTEMSPIHTRVIVRTSVVTNRLTSNPGSVGQMLTSPRSQTSHQALADLKKISN